MTPARPQQQSSVVTALVCAGAVAAQFIAAKAQTEDVLSSNRLASVDTARGHQGPYAFIDVASGLRGTQFPFVHLDISGVVVNPPDWQAGKPTGSPIAALVTELLEG